ncbi:hypothetical protein [Microcoleus sp. FACHB-672]|uniref:hypothetical protein n=1 Tax=Microcoleus sp. FACHB-672 TaxID=2692825 RepID=UPI0016878CEB|nr:hypothetical protein [Microcoleus sp. FACHB-672]MBD2043176.1 hypothetical protein [Microcoleus sp. FACHB-672]
MLEIALLEKISQNFQKTKDLITETTDKAKTSLSETAGSTKDTITQTSNQAFSNFTESTNKAIEGVTGIQEKAKGAFSETTTKAATTLTDTANKVVNSATEVAGKAKAFKENTFQQAESLNRSLSEGIQSTISSSLNVWIADHPRLIWLVNHPLQTAGILLLIIFLFSGLLKAISSYTEKLWLFLLQAPFKLIQFIFGLGSKSLGKVTASGLVATKSNEIYTSSDRQARMTNIVSRLTQIKQEQDLLLQELATLIKSDKAS